ncbi:hypothetical protein GCM10022419_083720 [Nonomuraea rosea]|uniref:Secreted protein n=1 Tax=Nonomuraea rosea TaxID=638574 RepID=A0ABP6YRS5_9ACTN
MPRLAAAATLVAGSIALAPGAAHAAAACSAPQEKTFNLPGKPDVWVGAELCIYSSGTSGNTKKAVLSINWDGSFLGGTRFDKFIAQSRVERHDTVLDSNNCDWKSDLNGHASSEGQMWDCFAWWTSAANGGWTADGVIIYNINNDGKGDMRWELGGSPSISLAPDGTETTEPSAEAPAS